MVRIYVKTTLMLAAAFLALLGILIVLKVFVAAAFVAAILLAGLFVVNLVRGAGSRVTPVTERRPVRL
jgi:hypothetical protein